MAVVRILACAAFACALPGCFLLPSGEASQVDTIPEGLRKERLVAPEVPDRHFYGKVGACRPGQWATYREDDRTFTLAMVGAGSDGAWFEVIDEGEPRLVSARLVSPEGVVRKAYYGEVGKDARSEVVGQRLRQWTPPPGGRFAEAGRLEFTEEVTVGKRTLQARGLRVRFEDADGRVTESISLWHPDVPPVYAGSPQGGLVLRLEGGARVKLLDFGSDAAPLLAIPPP